MSNNLFKSILNGTYQRTVDPPIIRVKHLSKCLSDLDLLAASITYSLIKPNMYDRVDYYWPLLNRCICNKKTNRIYISLVFNKPTSLKDLKLTYINNRNDLNLYPALKERVLSNLLNLIN